MTSTRTTAERAWLALAVVLVVVAAMAVLGWWRAQPPRDVGQLSVAVPVAAAADVITTTPATGPAGPTPRVSAHPAVPVVEQPPVAPVSLHADRLGGDVAVVPVGATLDGAMDIPADGSLVGWYRFGAAPGQGSGSAVLAGHVDTWDEGAGALFKLRDLDVGERLEVGLADGGRVAYQVTARVSVAKTALPVDDLFTDDGAPRLVLVTCGGEWLPELRSYSDNVVVTAEPLP